MREKILAVLVVVILCSLGGCASFGTDPYGYTIAGDTLSPEQIIRVSSQARNANILTDAEAHQRWQQTEMAKKCYDDYGPICNSLGYGIGYGGSVYMPYDYTLLGLMAAGNSANDGKDSNDSNNADTIEAKKRADRALNEYLELGNELKKGEK